MGLLSKIGKLFKKVIGVVAAVAAAVFIPGAGAFIGKAILGAAISIGASKLLAKRANTPSPSGGDAGGRVQLAPATDNKLPVIYGTAWVGGPIVDAKISTDQQYMWYVVALAEKTDTGTYSFDTANGVIYDGKIVQFGSNGVVDALITNNGGYAGTPQSDTRVAGKIYIWLFTNGYNSGINTGGQTAQQILSDSTTGGGIPTDLRWNSSLYTSGGQSPTMNNTCFAIIRVQYNSDAGTTSLGTLQVKLTNNLGSSYGANPADAIYDYMINDRYGCAIPLDRIDTSSLAALDTYSNQSIQYVDVNGVTQTQPYRYRLNGPLDTGQNCLNNLQFLVDSCDSWLQYSEATGKWRIVMNAPYSGSITNLFCADATNTKACNVIGGIQISPVDLNETFNQVEVAYPNTNVRDQTDYQIVDLTDPTTAWFPIYNQLLSPNEPINRLNITLPLVNQAVQAKYLAVRRLLQSREDLLISFQLDYSGIQLEAGDVIRVKHEAYGWDVLNGGAGKLFRVSQVNEQTLDDGSLVASVEAFEYNDTIYDDNAIRDFVPALNTGLVDPNVISEPCPPTITNFTDANALITGFIVSSCVPEQGVVKYMDFNYGASNVVSTHDLYRTVQNANGAPFINSPDIANGNVTTVSITVNDLPAGNFYWSVTARNDYSGRFGNGSNIFPWSGANVQPWNPNTNTGGLTGNQIGSNTLTLRNFSSSLNLSVNIGGNTYAIAEGNPGGNLSPVLLPVYANANTTRNVPLYIPPNLGWTTNGIYPYRQGTSLTTSGTDGRRFYIANSTGSYTPANAAILAIADGEDNWYMATQDDVTGLLGQYKTYTNNTGFTIVSDEDGSIIQIVQGVEYNNSGYYECQTNRLDTLEMPYGNFQYSWQRTYSVTALTGNAGNITGGATFIRNISNSATITLTGGTIQSTAAGSIYY